MDIAFLGYFVPEKDVHLDRGISMADNKMQYDYITSVESALGRPVTVFSSVNPKAVETGVSAAEEFTVGGSRGIYLPYSGRGARGQLSKLFSMVRHIRKWAKSSTDSQKVLLYYNTFFIYALAARIARIFCRFRTVPIAITLPYQFGEKQSFFHRMQERMSMRLFKRSSGIIAITSFLAERLCPGKPSCVVPGGIHPFQLEHNTPPEPGTPRRVVYTGALYGRYNLTRAIEAFGGLSPQQYRLCLYGRGEQLDEISRLCEQSPSADYCGFLSGSELHRVQREADVLLALLSTDDNLALYSFPSKVFEYMATGNPIIITDLKTLDPSMKRYMTVIDDLSPESIRAAVEKACSMDSLARAQLKSATREYLLKNVVWERQGERIVEFLSGIEPKGR